MLQPSALYFCTKAIGPSCGNDDDKAVGAVSLLIGFRFPVQLKISLSR